MNFLLKNLPSINNSISAFLMTNHFSTMKYKYPLLLTTFCVLITACTQKIKPIPKNQTTLEAEIKNWQTKRVQEITAPDGWLSLAGLYWLKEGITPFGSDPANKLVFPEKAPKEIGQFLLGDGMVTMIIEATVPVKLETTNPKNIVLEPDLAGNPTTLTLGSLSWYLIQRENRFGIRLKDAHNPKIPTFKGIPHFPISEKWQIPAILKPATDQKTITLRNVIDMDVTMKLEGYLHFEIEDQSYELEAMDGGKDSYFIIFADETTGIETYGAGRYLYVPRVNAEGKTLIDFNKAHNPPCAFTDFATCPLPSAKNRLEVGVLSGEKDYH